MIQFIKFQSLDPLGTALIRLDQIIAITPSGSDYESVIWTSAGNYRVQGSSDDIAEELRALVGSEWDCIPEVVR